MEKEIGNLLRLLKDQYSATSEERINDRLEKLEKHTHRLSDIVEYLVALKYAKARDHRDEVADFKEILDKCSDEVFTILHKRQVANPAAPVSFASCCSNPTCIDQSFCLRVKTGEANPRHVSFHLLHMEEVLSDPL